MAGFGAGNPRRGLEQSELPISSRFFFHRLSRVQVGSDENPEKRWICA
jgi:hypothetical protein